MSRSSKRKAGVVGLALVFLGALFLWISLRGPRRGNAIAPFSPADLAQNEKRYLKALARDEKLGRLDGIANNHAQLGTVNWLRNEFEEAEEHYSKALAIHEDLGQSERMATTIRTLAMVYDEWGKLDLAEEHYSKALAIYEKLGRHEGMASAYSDIGHCSQKRGDMEAAIAHWQKALDLFRKLGAPHMVDKHQRLIDRAQGRGGVE